MSNAANIRSVRKCAAIAQPTILGEYNRSADPLPT